MKGLDSVFVWKLEQCSTSEAQNQQVLFKYFPKTNKRENKKVTFYFTAGFLFAYCNKGVF